MHRLKNLILGVALVLGWGFECKAKPANIASTQIVMSDKLCVTLSLDSKLYKIKDSLILNVNIINNSDDLIYIYNRLAWGYGGGLILRLYSFDNKEIEPILRDDTMLTPPNDNGDITIFNKLTQNRLFGARRKMRIQDLIAKPGKYSLRVEYRCPLSQNYVSNKLKMIPTIWHENASIFSNFVKFEITVDK